MLRQRDGHRTGTIHSPALEERCDIALPTDDLVNHLSGARHAPTIGLPRIHIPPCRRLHQPGPRLPFLTGALQESAGRHEVTVEKRRHSSEKPDRLGESRIVFVNSRAKGTGLPPKTRQLALGQMQPRHLTAEVGVARVIIRELRKPLLRPLDRELVEIGNRQVEEHTTREVLEPGSLQETMGAELMRIRFATPTIIQRRRDQVELDHSQDARARPLVSHEFEQPPSRPRSPLVHELSGPPMDELRPQHRMVTDYPPPPARITEQSAALDPGELDIEPFLEEIRDTVPRAIDQIPSTRLEVPAPPTLIIENVKRRLPHCSRIGVEFVCTRQPKPSARPIVDRLEPSPVRIGSIVWQGRECAPCTARVIDCEAGLREEDTEAMSEGTRCELRQEISHRRAIERIEPRPRPTFEGRCVSVSQSSVEKVPWILFTEKARDLSVERVGLERRAVGETPTLPGLHDSERASLIFECARAEARVKSHESLR
jgi:hypothetical protein